MNVFTTIRPDASPEKEEGFVVDIFQDTEAGGWIAICDDIPVATEAETIEALIDRVWLIAPEIAELNGLPAGPELRLRFVVNTRAAS
ncbi:MAG TPA: DUF1902 domain-containing protein [Afifellaceae bacterium]|nr:DUF1902 domain-containing protein [Afifellaceae bacterium]